MRLQSLQDHTMHTPLQKAEQLQQKESASGISGLMKKKAEEAEKQDIYTPSTPEDRQPTGLYKIVPDEDGKPTIDFDDPRKQPEPEKLLDSLKPPELSSAKAEAPAKPNVTKPSNEPPEKEKKAAKKSDPEEESETCTINTDKVDREIRMLKKEKEQVEQQLRAAAGTDQEADLEKKLQQLENELRQKDNDGYRRQNAVVTHS